MRNFFYSSISAFALLLSFSTNCTATEFEVLKVRPENLPPLLPKDSVVEPPARDPFNWSKAQINKFKDQEPRKKSNSIAGLTLSGIIWDKSSPVAIINDRVVDKGDSVNDSTILEILKDMVVFEQDGIYHTLWLEPAVINLSPGKKR